MKLIVNTGPQWVHPLNTTRIMRGVFTALLPAAIFSVYLFGFRVIAVYLSAMISALLAEGLIQRLRGRPSTLPDSSALLTGLLLAMTLPPGLPAWMAAAGAFFGVGVGKMAFGGLGGNIFNPALVGRAFLVSAFPVRMTEWQAPARLVADATTSATPLALARFEGEITSLGQTFFGFTGGSLGETSTILLLLGGAWIILRRLADWRIPLAYLGGFFLLSFFFYLFREGYSVLPLFHLSAGGLALGAFFMATDPVTSPVTVRGRWIFGLGCAFFTFLIRNFSGLSEGVAYSILFMNALTPLINRMTIARVFGTGRKQPPVRA